LGKPTVRPKAAGGHRTTAESLVRAYRLETQRQKVMVKKAKLCEARLLSVSAAFACWSRTRITSTSSAPRNLTRCQNFWPNERGTQDERQGARGVCPGWGDLAAICHPSHPTGQADRSCLREIQGRAFASIKEVGVIEPFMVFPQRGAKGSYLLMDGHMRLKALQELGRTEAFCLVANDDDPFTYNDKVNRLSLIQEHAMIVRAIEHGVTPDQISKALSIDVSKVKAASTCLTASTRRPSKS
jgi:hypothetical protein